jgi:hypothetical protein
MKPNTLFLLFVLLSVSTFVSGQAQTPAPGDDPTVPKPRISAEALNRDPHPSSAGTPAAVPEEGEVAGNAYGNRYFGLNFALPEDWAEGFKGPKPSDSGYYVLGSMKPKGEFNGTIMIAAQDMFFYSRPVKNSSEMLKDIKDNLNEAQKVEGGPVELKISNHAFGRFDFSGAGLHFTQFATDIRCHVVTFVVTTRDQKVLDKFPAGLCQGLCHR